MHEPDPALTRLLLDLVGTRMGLAEAPLGRPADETELRASLKGLLGPAGNNPAEVLRRYTEQIEPSVISCDSPRFLAFIPGAPTKAAALFDMVVSAASLHGVSWLEAAGAIEAENQALRLLADLAGMPEQAGGTFVSGGSAGNLSALVVARDTARARLSLDTRAPLRIAVSDQTHSSVANTLRIIGVDPLVVPTEDHRLTGAALRAALLADQAAGDELGLVIGVVATAGTTNAGLVDDLAGLAQVAREHGLWFHVDAAYGGAGLFAPSLREKYRGIEHADSLVIDPHKWLFAPFDCGALLYRDPRLARAVHTQDASYLDAIHAEGDAEWNPSDYAYHLTRRPRGLPLWFSLAVHGTDAYREAVEHGLRMARHAAERVARTPGLELVREPELSVVLIRRVGWSAADHHAWCARLLRQGVGFLAPTVWEGETVARLAFVHPGITEEAVDQILASLAR
ncbi:aspartate aminotransferase family protein [Streptacidiphilus pinicola]|uniref:Aspartate aminotransferase family protein n=1 Tax=Streptacidiphilus pinicola TaxID=2219663 RepID=A0A2X0IJ50_9ACTN|nr:aminotransferase class I/II-fold pyridoxal phosphate-dependent enzyme [Streptacidiphilus pinicola]RAG83421.1 aspartate aminotransferase family protein [Streptacidiphilus pinicola]